MREHRGKERESRSMAHSSRAERTATDPDLDVVSVDVQVRRSAVSQDRAPRAVSTQRSQRVGDVEMTKPSATACSIRFRITATQEDLSTRCQRNFAEAPF